MANENPPAFPGPATGLTGDSYDEPGMTLRDWFAGQALAGLMSNPSHGDDGAVTYAFWLADAMLAERATPPAASPSSPDGAHPSSSHVEAVAGQGGGL